MLRSGGLLPEMLNHAILTVKLISVRWGGKLREVALHYIQTERDIELNRKGA